ncbi:MAG: acyl-CoA carboxylase subunit epsilon [Propionibacteriaceae bacterium]|nr:acyl-CoA carboxylase subunit epsilon [Propionibacteriaceae bacterium]
MTVVNADQTTLESPFVRVVRGQPTVEELVALVTGLMVLQGDAPGPASRPEKAHSAWTDRARLLHAHPFRRTAGDWQHSGTMSASH